MDARKLSFMGSLDSLPVSHRDLLNLIPVLMLFDYAMAFPNVSHAWVSYLLNKIMIPAVLFDGIWILYKNNKGYMNTDEGLSFVS